MDYKPLSTIKNLLPVNKMAAIFMDPTTNDQPSSIPDFQEGKTTANRRKMENDFPIWMHLALEVKEPGLMETERLGLVVQGKRPQPLLPQERIPSMIEWCCDFMVPIGTPFL